MNRTLNPLAVKRVKAKVLKAAGQDGADDLKPGQFKAIVSVFGNVDSYGDIVVPGAFLDTLSTFTFGDDDSNRLPVIWSHDWSDPDSHIGYALDAYEVPAAKFGPDSPAGLFVLGQNDIETNARAARVSTLMAGGRIKQFSFAYAETDAGYGVYGGEEAWLIKAADLFEVGPTLLGANQETTLIGAKRIIDLATRGVKSGAQLSRADALMLRELATTLAEIGVTPATDDQVRSDSNSNTNDVQGDTDATKDASDGDIGGASTPRTDDVMMLIDLALSDVEGI